MKKTPVIDFERFCRERGIATKRERATWVQINCPFCQDDSFHLGYKLAGGYFNCYRCGGMSLYTVIKRLFPTENIRKLIESYGGVPSVPQFRPTQKAKPLRVDAVLPRNTPLSIRHQLYLQSRGFDPEELEKTWGLRATRDIGQYAFRILIPVTHRNRVVSFQTRDITGRAGAPYIAALPAVEARPIKDCLYGYDLAKGQGWPFVVVFEGVPSVWRFGVGSVGTFGVEYTPAQVKLLSQWKTVLVWYDNDMAGMKKGERLAGELSVLGCRVVSLSNPIGKGKAPDEWTQSKCDLVRQSLLQQFG